MTTRIDDSKNHVPENSSNDVWEDTLAGNPADPSGYGVDTVALPPPRAKNELTAVRDRSLDHSKPGFHIVPLPLNTDDASADIEVQKFQGKVVRLENAVFSPEKIPRQDDFAPAPQTIHEDSHLHGVEHKWGRTTKRSIRWIISGGLGVAILVVFSLMMLPAINESNAERPGLSQVGLVIDSTENIGNIENLNEWLARRPEAMELFRVFATTPSVDDTLPLIRDSSQIQELVRKNHKQPAVSQNWSPPPSSTWIAFEVGDRICGVLEGALPDFSKFRAYMVDSGNHLMLDWKASTGHGSASFDELATGHGDPKEIRAFISPSGYYNHIFTEADYQSYQIVSPDENRSIWCYTRREGTAYTELENLFFEGDILKPEKLAYRVTVRLARGPEGTLPNQWVLEELLHHEWVNP